MTVPLQSPTLSKSSITVFVAPILLLPISLFLKCFSLETMQLLHSASISTTCIFSSCAFLTSHASEPNSSVLLTTLLYNLYFAVLCSFLTTTKQSAFAQPPYPASLYDWHRSYCFPSGTKWNPDLLKPIAPFNDIVSYKQVHSICTNSQVFSLSKINFRTPFWERFHQLSNSVFYIVFIRCYNNLVSCK